MTDSTQRSEWATADRSARWITTRRGDLMLRPETSDDEDFLQALFAANNEPALRLAAVPEPMIAQLLAFQHRSQNATYRDLFPNAIYSIVLRDEQSIGRLIENDEGEMVYFVDFALLPHWQAQGIGSALLGSIIEIWARRGRGARAKVLFTNEPSLKMCVRLGLAPWGEQENGYLELRRPPGEQTISGHEPC